MLFATTEGVVTKTWRFATPRDRVFQAWTSEDELMAWWRPGSYRIQSVRTDVKVGGTYEIVMVDVRGSRQRLSGEYVKIETSKRLVMTWRLEGSPADDGYEALLTLEFIDDGDGSLVVLKHERLRPSGLSSFAAGWEELLPKLERHIRNVRLP